MKGGRRQVRREVTRTALFGFAALASIRKPPAPRPPAQNEWVMTCPVYDCRWVQYVAGSWSDAVAVREGHVLTHEAPGGAA